MTKQDIVNRLIDPPRQPAVESASAYAPVNIALCKYWGKRDEELNLPVTSSLSISLAGKGTETKVALHDEPHDALSINGNEVSPTAKAAQRMSGFLDLFRGERQRSFRVETESNIPIAAGLASSASAFASLVKALNDLFGWALGGQSLSILARMGSGSACRSVYDGFVEWHVGVAEDGMDCFAEPLEQTWPALRLGLVTVSDAEKPIGSRAAMKRTRETCALYESWPVKVADDLICLKEAIRERDFERLGATAESNALAMHATMIATWPPVLYWLPESVATMHRIWELRDKGLPLYFTMDAGPNVKLLFEEAHAEEIVDTFPGAEIIVPFPS